MRDNSLYFSALKRIENLELREKNKKFEDGRGDMFYRARRVESNGMSKGSTGSLQLESGAKNDLLHFACEQFHALFSHKARAQKIGILGLFDVELNKHSYVARNFCAF
ncbi:MAG: hypothetical protein GY820_43245 [Gammaproteobacteria bacterium]|nr:hypothetical protein [Gammaproteobacteria bacterium]